MTRGQELAHKPTIAVIMPGESFHRRFLVAWTNLLISGIAAGFDIAPIFGYSSSVHTTRGALTNEVFNTPPNVQIDYALWIDDDQIVLPEHLKRLVSLFEQRPDLEIIGGWTWIAPDPDTGRSARVSCGTWVKGYAQESFSHEAMLTGVRDGKLMLADWTGFPCLMMRIDVLRKLGANPFRGILGPQFSFGMAGEDLAFCIRAEEKGIKIVIDPSIKVEHLKVQSVPDPPKAKVIDLVGGPVDAVKRAVRKFRFSVCHTSARPKTFRNPYEVWRRHAFGNFEYVLCADERWGFTWGNGEYAGIDKVVWNIGRKCAVDGWNTAFATATGDVLIMSADDFFPPENWDILLAEAIGDRDPQTEDFAIRVNTANPNQARDLFPTIISRARYKRLGYALYPEYDCMYSDDDDCEHILMDAGEGRTTLIDARASLMFHEHHPSVTGALMDEVYNHQMRPEAWDIGAAILQRRRAARFDGIAPALEAVSL